MKNHDHKNHSGDAPGKSRADESSGMDRRVFMKSAGLGAAMAATGLFPGKLLAEPMSAPAEAPVGIGGNYVWPMPEYPPTAPGTGNARPFWEGAQEGVETQSGHAIMQFPRDHRYHYGPIYHGPEFAEWYYISCFVNDKKSGDPYTIFWMSLLAGYDEGLKRPVKNAFMAAHNLRTGSFKSGVTLYPGELKTEGSATDAPKEDFWFRYTCGTPEHGEIEESYRAADETWRFKSSIKKPVPERKSVPIDLDVTGKVYAPGYVMNTPWGLENEGHDRTRQGLHNVETTYGLSYYTIAPRMWIDGRMTVDGQELEVEGYAWWEHQWGNMRAPEHDAGLWHWQNAYLDNGDMFRLRFWRKPDLSIDDAISNYAYIHADGRMEYALGPAIRWTTLKTYSSKITPGMEIPLYGKLETPQGTFYLAPEFPDQQAIGFAENTSLWEGVMYLHEGSIDGPIVGRSYTEVMIVPWYHIPRGFDLPMRAEIPRKLDGGLPTGPEFTHYK